MKYLIPKFELSFGIFFIYLIMNKSFLTLVFGLVFLTACKKDFNCSCTDEIIGTMGNVTTEHDFDILDATRREALNICPEATIVYPENTGIGQIAQTTCELKNK